MRKSVQTALETGEAAWCDMVKLELWNGARGDKEKRVLRDSPVTPQNSSSTSPRAFFLRVAA